MTRSAVSWIPVTQNFLFGSSEAWVFVLARGSKLRIGKILIAAVVVSFREGWDEHAQRGANRRDGRRRGRDAEKEGTWSQPSLPPQRRQIDGCGYEVTRDHISRPFELFHSLHTVRNNLQPLWAACRQYTRPHPSQTWGSMRNPATTVRSQSIVP